MALKPESSAVSLVVEASAKSLASTAVGLVAEIDYALAGSSGIALVTEASAPTSAGTAVGLVTEIQLPYAGSSGIAMVVEIGLESDEPGDDDGAMFHIQGQSVGATLVLAGGIGLAPIQGRRVDEVPP